MKKAGLFVIALFLLVSIFSFTISLAPVSAQSGTGSTDEILGQQLGVKPETIANLPKTPDEIRDLYLKQEWGKMIMGVPVIGSIHNLSVNNPMPFKIVFAEPYSLSLVFFMILALWILVAINATKFAKAMGFINKNLCWIAGVLVAIMIAQTKLYSSITNSALAVVFSKDLWWMRVIIWVVIICVVVLVYYIGGAMSESLKKYLDKRKEAQEKSELKQKVKKVEAFVKGAEEGIKLVD